MSNSALHDDFTGLPNRLLLIDRVARAIAHAHREREKLAVLSLSLSLRGDDGGDQSMRTIGKRLQAGLRLEDTVGRVGAQEFIILMPSVAHEDHAALVAQKILANVADPNLLLSIGICLYPDDGADAETLINNAGLAMSRAKQQGSNGYAFFKPHMNERAIERRFLESRLRHVLESQEFVMHYEPKLDLYSGAMIGAEALIRWRRPARGAAPPADYMSAEERSGYGIPVGISALRNVCRQTRQWQDDNLGPPPISIDASANELRSKDFVQSVREMVQDIGLDPGQLGFEVSEIALEKDLEATASVLRALKDMGVKITLDHFGTGRSSLTYLKNMPLDILKIDGSLVRGLCINSGDANIVDAVIGAARSFHLHVVAEGVETREQFLALQNQGCTEGQGSYFRGPVPADEFAKLLASDCGATAEA